MNARMLIVAVSTAMFISTAAFAASMTSAQQCTALENQFDQEIVKHAACRAQKLHPWSRPPTAG